MQPRIGQFVSRELTQDGSVCYITDIKGTATGGNGTVHYQVTVEDFNGKKSEDIIITSGDTCNYETTEWQCAVCECFTTCVCDRNRED
jgi:hypothetical protein